MKAYPTREEAQAEAIAQMMADDDANAGGVVRTCVCGRPDLHAMNDADLCRAMAACDRCEVLVIGAGGNA